MPRLTSFNQDSEESKLAQLHNIFTELKEYDIKYALKKASGDFQTALDDLLNIQYLQSTGQQAKGIDGFFQPDEEVGKKSRGKRKGKKASSSNNIHIDVMKAIETSGSGEKEMKCGYSPQRRMLVTNRCLIDQDEISYIADRLNVPFSEVSDIYYRKKCSSASTAVEIINQYISLGIETQDEAGKKQAQDLAQKYRNVPERYMPTVVQFTDSMPQWADDIAALLSKHFAKHPWSQKLDLSYTLTPLAQDDLEGFEPVPPGKTNGKRVAKPSTSRPGQPADPSVYAQVAERANRYNQAKREAAASASRLNRRGASSPLYRQAAGYYSDVAREQGRLAQQASSTAADLLVDQQSTRTSIDLHGVYVQDGVRIARERVQAWWAGLGDFKSEKARQQHFTVITGLGRHSAGGVSQLRQAVAAALLQDGWKLQVETGHFVVKGRR